MAWNSQDEESECDDDDVDEEEEEDDEDAAIGGSSAPLPSNPVEEEEEDVCDSSSGWEDDDELGPLPVSITSNYQNPKPVFHIPSAANSSRCTQSPHTSKVHTREWTDEADAQVCVQLRL